MTMPNEASAVGGGIAPLFHVRRLRPAATDPQRWPELNALQPKHVKGKI
jgi:hypothetical protein